MDDVLYTIRGPKTYSDMTWEELQEALRETDIVLVPIGSTEQHGPHLPLYSDTWQGIDIAKRVARQLAAKGIKVVPGPAIPFGPSSYMTSFPGTISISADLLKALIKQVCLALISHGFKKIVLVLGHGGNWPTMQVAAQELVDETNATVIAVNWLPVQTARYAEVLGSKKPESHSGEGETSRMLATIPELVVMDRVRAFHPAGTKVKIAGDEKPLLGGGYLNPIKNFKDQTPVGNIGDPGRATVETGEKLYAIIVDWICALIERDLA